MLNAKGGLWADKRPSFTRQKAMYCKPICGLLFLCQMQIGVMRIVSMFM